MNYQSQFKDNYLRTVWLTTKAVCLNVSIAYVIVMLITGIMVAITIWTFLGSFTSPFTPNNNSILNSSEYLNKSLFPSMLQFIGLISIFLPVSMFVSAWYYNFSFIAVNSKIKNNDIGFAKVFKKSFNSGIFKIILITVFFVIFVFLFSAIITFSVQGDKWLIVSIIIGSSLIAFFFLYKSILILPAYVIGEKSLDESVQYSFSNITFLRVIKFFAASIAFFILLIIIEVIIMGSSFLFSFIPINGTFFRIISSLFQMIIFLLFSGFVTTFIISAITGLYYRYQDELEVIETIDYQEDDVEKVRDNEEEPPSEMINNLFA